MDDSKAFCLLPFLLLFGMSTITSLLGMAHYNKMWRLPNRSEMNTKVKHFNILPDVIDKKQNLTFIQVNYRQTVKVWLGNKIAPQAIEDPPSKITWKAKNETLHTLLLVDPDWPIKKPATWNQLPHWMVGNIPGANVDEGETIMEYVGYRATVCDEHPHRYVYLVYTQPNKEPIKFDEPKLTKEQVWEREVFRNFSAQFVEIKYNLTNIGLNFFVMEHKKPYLDDNTDLEAVAARQIGAVTSPFK